MIELFRTCRRHRAALLDFVDHGQIGPPTADALAHLEGCESCTEMLDSTVLAIAALRRLGDDAARIEPALDSWPRLRARLTARRPGRVAIVSPLGGMVMTVALAAILVAPLRLSLGPASDRLGPATGSADPTSSAPAAVYTRPARHSIDESNTPAASTARAGTQPKVIYPDGGRPSGKEVPASRSSVRPTEPR